MNRQTLWFVAVAAAMIAVGAGAWVVVRDDIAAFKDTSASIAEQKAILEEVKAERMEFREKLDNMAKSIRDAPDSTAASRGGAILDMSFVAGKEQALIDQKELRAEKRLAFQSDRREAARKKLVAWGTGAAVAEAVLLAAAFVVPRAVGRRRKV